MCAQISSLAYKGYIEKADLAEMLREGDVCPASTPKIHSREIQALGGPQAGIPDGVLFLLAHQTTKLSYPLLLNFHLHLFVFSVLCGNGSCFQLGQEEQAEG